VQVPSPGLAELHTVNDGLLATLLAEIDVTQSAMTETEWAERCDIVVDRPCCSNWT
jgi:hypothetical protein